MSPMDFQASTSVRTSTVVSTPSEQNAGPRFSSAAVGHPDHKSIGQKDSRVCLSEMITFGKFYDKLKIVNMFMCIFSLFVERRLHNASSDMIWDEPY